MEHTRSVPNGNKPRLTNLPIIGTFSGELGVAMRAAVVAGVGAMVPDHAVTNADLVDALDTTDEWIRGRTGIERRHRVAPGTATVDLAARAGHLALKSAGGAGGAHAADMVLLATSTPDLPCPASAPEVAARLGLPGVAAYDVAAVCSGFVYALAAACGHIASGTAERVLVIGADTFSTIVDPADRTTAVLFGDGAGAVLLRAGDGGEPGAVGPFDLGSDGTGAALITVPGGGSRARSAGAAPEDGRFLVMEGQAVFRRALGELTASSSRALAKAGWRVGDVTAFVGHQANQRILDAVADRLGIAAEHRLGNIADVGNTAAASIPIALADAAARGRLGAGDRVLLAAFGGGLTWGATTLVWPQLEAMAELPRF